MMKVKTPKDMLKVFDGYYEQLNFFSGKKDISSLLNSIKLMLKQMKLLREKATELGSDFSGTDEEFTKKALQELAPVIEPIHKKLMKIDQIEFNRQLFRLPDKKGRIFFEIMAESEDIASLSLKDPARRQRNDNNIAKMEEFLGFLKSYNQEIKSEREKYIRKPANVVKVLQLKIVLSGSKPRVWRRFLVKDNISFHKLHLVIQTVMGWDCCHLYSFEDNNLRIESKECASDDCIDFEPAEKILLSQVLKEKDKIRYTYDFGDTWEHILTVEKVLDIEKGKKYPCCVAGKSNCPPEDSGGIYGFYDMFSIASDKDHEDHEYIKDWLADYDIDEFDIDEINKELRGR